MYCRHPRPRLRVAARATPTMDGCPHPASMVGATLAVALGRGGFTRLCFGCCCLPLDFKAFRSQGTLQPTHKHFYKHRQNSYGDCSNHEFSIIEDRKSVYNIVPIAPSADEC